MRIFFHNYYYILRRNLSAMSRFLSLNGRFRACSLSARLHSLSRLLRLWPAPYLQGVYVAKWNL